MHHGHDRGINLRVSYLKFRRQASQILDQIEEYSCGSTRYFKESMLMDNIVPFVSLKVIRFFCQTRCSNYSFGANDSGCGIKSMYMKLF